VDAGIGLTAERRDVLELAARICAGAPVVVVGGDEEAGRMLRDSGTGPVELLDADALAARAPGSVAAIVALGDLDGAAASLAAHAGAGARVVVAPAGTVAPDAEDDRLAQLERANAELEIANRRLARSWLGRSDMAAAGLLARLAERTEAAERRAAVAEAHHEERVRVVLARVDELTAECLAIGDERATALRDWLRADAELRSIRARRSVKVALRLSAIVNALRGDRGGG
jgi:hypothetical protein